MPELPEVETLRRGLEKYIVGHKIIDVEIHHPKVFTGNEKSVVGVKVIKVRRFAKVLSIDLSNDNSLLVHVKLTGQLIYRGPNFKKNVVLSKKVLGGVPGKFTHVIFKLDKNGFLYYNDIRRFGWIKLVPTKQVETSDFIGKLGPEPFAGLTMQIFKQIISKYKTPIKLVLMDQEKMGGIGNIYANDALWLAKIYPKRPANSLNKEEQEKLYNAIIEVLKNGIKYGGASELAFVTAEGADGNYQNHFRVYGQQGKSCQRCGTKIEKVFLGGRGTYFCPTCQK